MTQPATTRAVIKGYDGMVRQKMPRSWSQQNAETITEVWKGPRDKARTMYDGLIGSINIDSISYDPSDGAYDATVTITYKDSSGTNEEGGGGLVVDEENNAIWEVAGMEIQKDIRVHPYFMAPSVYIDQTTINKSIYEEMINIDLAIAQGKRYVAPAHAITNWKNKLSRYYALRLQGVDTYIDNAMVLKKNVTVTKRTLVNVAWAGVGYCMNINTINPPNAIVAQMKDIYRLKRPPASDVGLGTIAGINAFYVVQKMGAVDWDHSQWEWLKKAPTVTAIEDARRWTITYEWWGAERWSSVFYNGSWDPSVDIDSHETK